MNEHSIATEDFVREFVGGVARNLAVQNNWTEAVRDTLRAMGKAKKHFVAPDPSVGQPEFLFDLLWFENENLNDIVLAVESEWGRKNCVQEDFQKLLHVKSPLKLLVFNTRSHKEQSAGILKSLEKDYLQKFGQHLQGEKYIVLEFAYKENIAYWYSYEVPSNGTHPSAEFRPMEPVPYILLK